MCSDMRDVIPCNDGRHKKQYLTMPNLSLACDVLTLPSHAILHMHWNRMRNCMLLNHELWQACCIYKANESLVIIIDNMYYVLLLIPFLFSSWNRFIILYIFRAECRAFQAVWCFRWADERSGGSCISISKINGADSWFTKHRPSRRNGNQNGCHSLCGRRLSRWTFSSYLTWSHLNIPCMA